jgi:osmoprotectant transport system permease protein
VLILLVTPFGLSIIGPHRAGRVRHTPLLAGTYAGLRNVDPAVVDARRWAKRQRVLWRVELPNALPLMSVASAVPCCR